MKTTCVLLLCLCAAIVQAKVAEVKVAFKCPKTFPCTCETKEDDDGPVNFVNCQAKKLRNVPNFSRINTRDSVTIDLSNNSIRYVPRGRFKGLRIDEVKFNNNPMKQAMDERAFEEVSEVISIQCKNCSLPKIPNIFRHTEGLEILNLETNNISKIAPGTFRDAILRELYVGENVFFPAAYMFEDLIDSLERLSLSRSFFFQPPVDAVTELVNLKRLDLDYNFISKLNKKQMLKLPRNITYLDLGHNPVEDIEYGALEAFVNSREGVTLNFVNSKIGKVDFFEDVCRLNRAYMPLTEAPLVCDCNLYNITRDGAFNTTGYCDSPKKFKWYSIYGDNSFVSNTYDDEWNLCPNVYKLPCRASAHFVVLANLIILVIAAILLEN